jgi:hypothetical protein
MNGFQDVEIWTRRRTVEEDRGSPVARGTTDGRPAGPAGFRWRADQPATILWVEALDGGDLKNKVPSATSGVARRAVLGEPVEVAKTEWRYDSIATPTRHRAPERERSRSHRTRTWIAEPGAAPEGVGSQTGRGVRQPGLAVAGGPAGGRGGGRNIGGGPSCRTANTSHAPGRRVGGRRSSVPRQLNIKTLKSSGSSAPRPNRSVVRSAAERRMTKFLTL